MRLPGIAYLYIGYTLTKLPELSCLGVLGVKSNCRRYTAVADCRQQLSRVVNYSVHTYNVLNT